jgi:amidase
MVSSPFASALELAGLIASKSVSSEALTELYLSRIRAHNPALQAVIVPNAEDARRTARDRDADLARGAAPGLLHGVPITVKESFDVAGLPTTVNFRQLKDNVATADALVVTRAREAGAVVLGKTNIPTMLSDYQSFGPIYPRANNPYDVTRTPGGSTGGGAAAVAAGLTTIEFGSDIGGSIRLPAHFCGVFGLKPTENAALHGEGHVPPLPDARTGFVAMASMGPLARTMSDIELAWRVMNRQTWSPSTHLPSKPRSKAVANEYRVAWCDEMGPVGCDDDTKKAMASVVQSLERAGVRCERRPFDDRWLRDAYAVWGALFGVILGQTSPWLVRQVMKLQMSRMGRGSALGIGAAVRDGLSLDFKRFSTVLRRRTELIAELQRRFDDFDFIICPVAAGPAFAHNPQHRPIVSGSRSLAYVDYVMPFTLPYNSCGNPVLVIPAGRSGEGLPIGCQIAAPHYAEDDLVHFGRLAEGLGARFTPPDAYI